MSVHLLAFMKEESLIGLGSDLRPPRYASDRRGPTDDFLGPSEFLCPPREVRDPGPDLHVG